MQTACVCAGLKTLCSNELVPVMLAAAPGTGALRRVSRLPDLVPGRAHILASPGQGVGESALPSVAQEEEAPQEYTYTSRAACGSGAVGLVELEAKHA